MTTEQEAQTYITSMFNLWDSGYTLDAIRFVTENAEYNSDFKVKLITWILLTNEELLNAL